jgi:hypothetical protein
VAAESRKAPAPAAGSMMAVPGCGRMTSTMASMRVAALSIGRRRSGIFRVLFEQAFIDDALDGTALKSSIVYRFPPPFAASIVGITGSAGEIGRVGRPNAPAALASCFHWLCMGAIHPGAPADERPEAAPRLAGSI